MVSNASKVIRNKNKWRILLIAAIIIGGGGAVVWLKVIKAGSENENNFATYTVTRGPLAISVLESGTIKAREQVILKNELEGRTSIINLVPEGMRVQKGDLLVELDASTLLDDKIDQEIMVQNTEAAFINATENLAIVENQAESDVDLALLTYDFAVEDLRQYKEGLFPNELKAAEAKITLANEELSRAEETLKWSQKLSEKKYIANSELQADELAVKRRSLDLQLAENDRNLLNDFTNKRSLAQLESDIKQAKMALERTKRKANANVVQAKADLKAKKAEFDRQSDKLEKLEQQIDKTKIIAPSDGLAIYATSARRGGYRRSSEPLDVGQEVYERQELIYLPTGTSSKVEVDIHEASLEKVQLDLPAVITVDALPGQKFFGTVATIAPLPDAQSMWMNPDLKVYNSEIYLEGNQESLRTGMSCKAEIIVEQYEDALYIPVQSVIRINNVPTVFVVEGDSYESRTVKIGLDNNQMVHILEGLQEGEEVLLTPPLKSAAVNSLVENSLSDDGQTGKESQNLNQKIRGKLDTLNGSRNNRSNGYQNNTRNPRDTMDRPANPRDRDDRPKPGQNQGRPGGRREIPSSQDRENRRQSSGGNR
jgi:HlyD family secretion protein